MDIQQFKEKWWKLWIAFWRQCNRAGIHLEFAKDLESLKEQDIEEDMIGESNWVFKYWDYWPSWIWYDEDWEKHIDEYKHQDWKFSEMCKSGYCRCSQ